VETKVLMSSSVADQLRFVSLISYDAIFEYCKSFKKIFIIKCDFLNYLILCLEIYNIIML